MNKINDLPDTLSVFPLSNFIFFPNTSAPLNVFEPRYIQMIDESVKSTVDPFPVKVSVTILLEPPPPISPHAVV